MKTKFDIQQENAEIRAKRQANIKALNEELREAKDIYAVLPNSSDLGTMQERRVVHSKIKHLNELIADEQRAIDSLLEADNAAVVKAVEMLVD